MANNVMNMDGSFKPFRAWCQLVLPQVYDDSLSYMELLNKVIAYINSFGEYLEEYTVINKIVYEGIWDITKNYKINSVVSDNGYGYLSLQAVPAGVPITATDYWLKIADFAGEIIDLGERVLALEGRMDNVDTDIDNIETNIDEIETSVNGLDTRITNAETAITNINTDISEINTDISEINTTIEKMQNNNSWLSGKKVVWYGDSWGTTVANPVSAFLSDYSDVEITNRCIGGTTLSRINIEGYTTNSGYQLIMAANDLDEFDYIFIMYGVNDWQLSIPLKTKNPSEYEFLYCAETIIHHLQSTFPTCKPVFILQSYCYKAFASGGYDGINYAGVNQPGYINNIIDLCEEFNVSYINLFDLAGVNRTNYTDLMRFDDPVYVHPKVELSHIIANIIYHGNLNTGKVYGNNWSGNVAESTINFTNADTPATYETLVPNVANYPRYFAPNNSSIMINSPVHKNTVIHLKGYKDTTSLLGIVVVHKDGENANVSTGITNINKVSLIDCYIEFDYHDMYWIRLQTVDVSIADKIYGCEIRFKGGDQVIHANGIAPNPIDNSVCTLTEASPTIIEDGVQYIQSFNINVLQNINAFSPFIDLMSITYGNKALNIPVVDINTGNTYMLYLYNRQLRSRQLIPSGANLCVPNFEIKVPV